MRSYKFVLTWVQDVLDSRAAGWKTRHDNSGPKTIAQIHQDVCDLISAPGDAADMRFVQAKQQEAEASRKAASSNSRLPKLHEQLGRPGSRRGQGREAVGADGWTTPAPRPNAAGDLTSFGTVRSSQRGAQRLGTGQNVFNRGKQQPAKDEIPADAARTQNAFAALATDATEAAPEPTARQPLKLLARSKPVPGEEGEAQDGSASEEEASADEEEPADEPTESKQPDAEAVERSITNSVTEFFAIKNINEGVESFKALPAASRPVLATKLALAAVEKKAAEVDALASLFEAIREAESPTMSADDFKSAMGPVTKELADVATDVSLFLQHLFAPQLIG